MRTSGGVDHEKDSVTVTAIAARRFFCVVVGFFFI
jgi:hypothetical protein